MDVKRFSSFQCPKCAKVMVNAADVLYWLSTADEEELGRSWNVCIFCSNQINALAIRDGRFRPVSSLTHWFRKRARLRFCR